LLAVSTFSGGLFSELDFASGFVCNRWRHELRDCGYHGTFLISLHLRYALTRDIGWVPHIARQWDAAFFERNLTDAAPRAVEFVKLLTKNARTRQTRR
jgi:hypothetical protein